MFRYYFTDKLNLKNNKTIALTNLSIYFTLKNLNLNTTITNLKFLPKLGMEHLKYQMDLMLSLIFKIILSLV